MSNSGFPDDMNLGVESRGRRVAADLQAAVGAECYEDVLALLAEYERQFKQALHAVSGDPDRAQDLVTEANDFLRWAKSTVRANRAHAQVELSRLSRASRYQPAETGKSRSWRVEA